MPKNIASIRMERLNSLMLMLLSGNGSSKSEIMSVLEYKTGRTLERDVAMLRGRYLVDIRYDIRTAKYKCFDAGQFLLKFSASREEIVALVAGLGMASHFLPHLDKDASALWENFRRLIPKELMQQGEILSRSVIVSLPVSSFDPVVLQKMIDGINLKSAVEIKYSSPYKECSPEKKIVSPWGVYFQSHAWYVWAGDKKYPNGATYRISRISEISPTSEPSIAPPDDCDVEQYAGSAWFARPGELVHDIKLHLFPPLSHIVKETTWHRTQKIETLPDGSIIYTAKVPGIEEVARWAMSCPPHIEALEPVELRKRMFELGDDVVKRHEN